MNQRDIDLALNVASPKTGRREAAMIVYLFLTELKLKASWWQRPIITMIIGHVEKHLKSGG